jgi:hypothetical protein
MNTELSIDEQIAIKLSKYGIADYPGIEQEDKEVVLTALSQDDIWRVFIDKDGALVIEYNEEE